MRAAGCSSPWCGIDSKIRAVSGLWSKSGGHLANLAYESEKCRSLSRRGLPKQEIEVLPAMTVVGLVADREKKKEGPPKECLWQWMTDREKKARQKNVFASLGPRIQQDTQKNAQGNSVASPPTHIIRILKINIPTSYISVSPFKQIKYKYGCSSNLVWGSNAGEIMTRYPTFRTVTN